MHVLTVHRLFMLKQITINYKHAYKSRLCWKYAQMVEEITRLKNIPIATVTNNCDK